MKKIVTLIIVFISILSFAQNINFTDQNFKNYLLSCNFCAESSSSTPHFGNADINGDGEIQISEAAILTKLTINDSQIVDVTELSFFTNLLELNIFNYSGASINLDNQSSLTRLFIEETQNLSQISDLSNLVNLTHVGIFTTGITLPISIILNNAPIQYLDIRRVANISITNVSNSIQFRLDEISSSITINQAYFNSNSSNIWLSGIPNSCTVNIIDLSVKNLYLTSITSNELDLSQVSFQNLDDFNGFNNIDILNLKNGIVHQYGSTLDFQNIRYVCLDDFNISSFNQNISNTNINPLRTISSYCSFTPGGSFNEIEGTISMDINSNGCNLTDPVFSNFNFTATDGTNTGTLSSNQSGEYYAPVQDGQHTITPNPENPSYWNFSPANVVVDFPTQASPFSQDFCVTANGSIEDLEVFVLPLEQARPGFETDYKVVIKNKGNVTTSGSVTLDFQEDFMTLLSTNPNAGNSPSNQLSWSFNNLQPFQMEEYEFTMTLNTPTATVNPLNSNDILTFTGTVAGTGTDALPADNMMVLDQIVVNSFDPNDKTCLEGETIEPADVGEYVHYMIRFENTGTASAINVVIKDEIDLSQFDITTLIPLGGSHDYYTRIREGNIVEFIHEDINLDFNDATNDGYVLFKIKTLTTLTAGDTFDNTAGIYFDFNFPIITNTETVTVMSTASIGATTDSSITVFPNPASGFMNITAANRLESATIIDMNGRMLSQTSFTGNTLQQQISLENLSSGIYFVTIQSDLGQKVEQLIVQ